MKYIVIGAGISGMAIAHLLSENNDVILFEKNSRPGGMIKCDRVNGSLFHRTGGHIFNTKREDVSKWFWRHFDREHDFIKADRNASVVFGNDTFIPYPIENHFYLLGQGIGEQIISDLFSLTKESRPQPSNFEEFLKTRFGKTLYELYFQPYNRKVWRQELSTVPLSWLEGKLPMPTYEEIIYNNIFHIEEKRFVHSSFYYPRKGGSQFIADTLAKGLDIRYNHDVKSINRIGDKWMINGKMSDRIIFCGNIKDLPKLLGSNECLKSFEDDITSLESHGTTSVFCKIDPNPYSWIYQPDDSHHSHRIICTGNFSDTNNAYDEMTATIEFTDKIDKAAILEELDKMPLNPEYIAHNYEKYTYPIQDLSTRGLISSIKKALEREGIFLCGRFAEWEYYNMDVCIGSAIDLYNNKLKN